MTTSSASVSIRSIPRRLLAIGIAVFVVAIAVVALTLRAGSDSNTAQPQVPAAPQVPVVPQAEPVDVGCLHFQVHNFRVC